MNKKIIIAIFGIFIIGLAAYFNFEPDGTGEMKSPPRKSPHGTEQNSVVKKMPPFVSAKWPVKNLEENGNITVLSDGKGISTQPKLFTDEKGNLYAGWVRNYQGKKELLIIKNRVGGTDWETFDSRVPFKGDVKSFSAAFDSRDSLHLSIYGGVGDTYNAHYAMMGKDGWTEAQNISDSSLDFVYPPILLVDRGDNPHLAWCEFFGKNAAVYHLKKSGGEWDEIEDYSKNIRDDEFGVSMALGDDGSVHLAFHHIYAKRGVSYTFIDKDGKRGKPLLVSGKAVEAEEASLVLDETGRPHIFFYAKDGKKKEIYYTSLGETGWKEPVNLTRDGNEPMDINVLLDSNGKLVLLWNGFDTDGKRVIFKMHGIGDEWSGPEKVIEIGKNSRGMNVVRLDSGILAVIWQELANNNWEIYFSKL